MTGLVQHSDVVVMASYAPLLAKYGHQQWQPNLIWFDNEKVVLTPSYHAQAMFAQNRPDNVLPIEVEAPKTAPTQKGMIGVGTWKTQAEYRNIRVTAPNGEVLFESDFADGLAGWQATEGKWSIKDGALRQTSDGENLKAIAGDPNWTDYTLTLEARKLGGEEGFLILFHSTSLDATMWWNLGGWTNTEHAIQNADVPERRVRGKIEKDRWYQIRLELAGPSIKAFLDDKLIEEATVEAAPVIFAAAGRDDSTGEIILQLVNPHDEPREASIQLAGLSSQAVRGRIFTMQDSDSAAENSREAPDRVAPREAEFPTTQAKFNHTVPANSVQILRLVAVQE